MSIGFIENILSVFFKDFIVNLQYTNNIYCTTIKFIVYFGWKPPLEYFTRYINVNFGVFQYNYQNRKDLYYEKNSTYQ